MPAYEDSCLNLPLSSGTCSIENVPKLFAHIKVLHINARDLRVRSKLAELTNIACSADADVVCVSETFLDRHDISVFNIDGYNHHGMTRKNKGGGGVSLFIRKEFTVIQPTFFSTDDEAVQLVRCHLVRRNIACYIVGFYSNNRCQLNELLNQIEAAVAGLALPTILLGDSNVNILAHDSMSNEYLSFLANRGFLPTITGVTRIASGTCLDHIFVSAGHPLLDVSSQIIKSNVLSDHFPV